MDYMKKTVKYFAIVAETFNKRHTHILDTIAKLAEPKNGLSENFIQRNFALSSYKDNSGKQNKMYLLTKDGFAIVVMGFTGKKATTFKEAYIYTVITNCKIGISKVHRCNYGST